MRQEHAAVQRFRPEARQRALAHGLEIDPDGRERGLVKAAEDAAPDPHQLLLDAVRPQAVRAQHGGSGMIAFDQREQQMLGAQVAVSEPDRVFEPATEDRPGAGRHSLKGLAVTPPGRGCSMGPPAEPGRFHDVSLC